MADREYIKDRRMCVAIDGNRYYHLNKEEILDFIERPEEDTNHIRVFITATSLVINAASDLYRGEEQWRWDSTPLKTGFAYNKLRLLDGTSSMVMRERDYTFPEWGQVIP